MAQAYIGLGANLGDAHATLQQALADLAYTPGVSDIKASGLYRTAPVDSDGPDYLNAVVSLQTSLDPLTLLRSLQAIEQIHGRQRPYRNAPRTLDLDLLWFDDTTINEPDLIVPHPRMHERAFVLAPLQELAPELELPQGKLQTLLAACADQAIERVEDLL